MFLNHRIDLVTLRLFSWLISQQRINSLKLSSNSLEHEADEVRRLLEKEGTLNSDADQLNTLYFEWNPLLEHPRRRELFLTAARPTLQHLILRECRIGNALLR